MTILLACFEEATASLITPVVDWLLIVFGVVVLFLSVRRLRQSRLVAHTAETPVSALSPGLVHLFGRVEGDDPLMSPLTGSPCFYYESHAQRCYGSGQDAHWSTIRRDIAHRDFHLNDGTGRVLVHPDYRGVFDLPATLEASMKPGAAPSCKADPLLGMPALTEQEMVALLQWDWKSPRPSAMSGASAPEQHDEPKHKWWVPESIAVGGFEVEAGGKVTEFKLTEICLQAGREYSIVATCESVAGAKGQPSLVLKRGSGETTFVISSQRGAVMAGNLRRNGLLMMLAGLFSLGFGLFMVFSSGWSVG